MIRSGTARENGRCGGLAEQPPTGREGRATDGPNAGGKGIGSRVLEFAAFGPEGR